MSRWRASLIALVAVAVAPAAPADTIYLRNGRTIVDCTVVREDAHVVVVRVKTGKLIISKREVDFVEKAEKPVKFVDWSKHLEISRPVAPERAPSTTSGAGEGSGDSAKKEGSGGDSPKGSVEEDLKKVPAALRKAALEAVGLLGAPDPDTRRSARRTLTSLGLKISPVLVSKLKDRDLQTRLAVADVLGGLGARDSVKPLMEALIGSTPDDGMVPAWNRSYVRSVHGSLERITGASLPYGYQFSNQKENIEKWIAWWDANWSKYPRQVGEPELDKKAEGYDEQLKKSKELDTRKISFPEPKMKDMGRAETTGG